jgi:hypothetical protein
MTGDNDINSDPMDGYMALLTTPLPDLTQQSQTGNQEVDISTIERPLTGMDGRRLRHEDHHVLRAVDDLCDLCILIMCMHIRIRHIFVSMFVVLIVLLSNDV